MKKILILTSLIINPLGSCMSADENRFFNQSTYAGIIKPTFTNIEIDDDDEICLPDNENYSQKKQVHFDEKQVKEGQAKWKSLPRSNSITSLKNTKRRKGQIPRYKSLLNFSSCDYVDASNDQLKNTIVPVDQVDWWDLMDDINQKRDFYYQSRFSKMYGKSNLTSNILLNNLIDSCQFVTLFVLRHAPEAKEDLVHTKKDTSTSVEINPETECIFREWFKEINQTIVYSSNINRNKLTAERLFCCPSVDDGFNELEVNFREMRKVKAIGNDIFKRMLKDHDFKNNPVIKESVNDVCSRVFSTIMDKCEKDKLKNKGILVANSMVMNCILAYLDKDMEQPIMFDNLTGFIIRICLKSRVASVYTEGGKPVIFGKNNLNDSVKLMKAECLKPIKIIKNTFDKLISASYNSYNKYFLGSAICNF